MAYTPDKVSVYLSGGIGNRIFQIFGGLHYAEKHNKEFVISKNNIGNDIHDTNTINAIQQIFKDISIVDTINHRYIGSIDSTPITYVDLPYCDGNILLTGYFQTEKYLPSKTPNIRTTYYPNTYFIHIRAGDYINNPVVHINLEEYYEKSIKLIQDKTQNSKFIVFSNDTSYAVEYMKKYHIEYKLSDTKTGYDTLLEMANCAGGICANSSLGWLGAYFQKEMRGIICMPSEWIRFFQIPTNDIYPSWATVISVN
jgi:hypothetical protein